MDAEAAIGRPIKPKRSSDRCRKLGSLSIYKLCAHITLGKFSEKKPRVNRSGHIPAQSMALAIIHPRIPKPRDRQIDHSGLDQSSPDLRRTRPYQKCRCPNNLALGFDANNFASGRISTSVTPSLLPKVTPADARRIRALRIESLVRLPYPRTPERRE